MIENRSAARGPVVPVLVYEDVGKAIEWLCETFGFEESFRSFDVKTIYPGHGPVQKIK